MPQLTLTDAGRTALAAASSADQINMNEVRLGSGRIAAGSIAAATALQTPIAGAVYRAGASGSRSAAVSKSTTLAYQLIATDASNNALAPTEMGLFDANNNLIAYGAAAASAQLFNKPANQTWRFIVSVTFDTALARDAITYEVGAVLPASLTVAGIAQLASNREAIAGTDAAKIVTPAASKAAFDARLASDNEARAGTDANKTLTPASGKAAIDDRIATQAEVDAGSNAVDFVTPNTLANTPLVGGDVQEFNYGDIDLVWNKPAGARMVMIELWGGGGGAADSLQRSGAVTLTSHATGGGGAYTQTILPADALPETVAIIVGRGGLGSKTAVPTRGAQTQQAGDGGDTQFGGNTYSIYASGGGGARARFGAPETPGAGGGTQHNENAISEQGSAGVPFSGSAVPAVRQRAGVGGARNADVYSVNRFGETYGAGGVQTSGAQAELDGNAGFARITSF